MSYSPVVCFLFFYHVFGQECFRCLCYAATKCNLTVGCDEGYCGPYKISKIYWKDAGEVILPDDERKRDGAYEDCAISYQCAQRIVLNYIAKYGRVIMQFSRLGNVSKMDFFQDCNNDGVTNCDDFSLINFNGGFQCKAALSRNEAGQSWLERYRLCNPETLL
ncbi:uncharacterized protein LOC123003933 isoform X2 [Tribolium madens]|uniref:uncharacterized protein LOC123003933 isoform X2 n=1 Tax=Tribolium madens TaxID=41895 RepID=UPI001CF74E52|nr:uncharacterized protein LOC123003933 isoform X2 [Tribolium madens]